MTGEIPALLLQAVVKRRTAADRTFELSVGRLAVMPGEAVALTGPSGCGKSTLIDLLALSLRPDEGRCFLVVPPGEPEADVLALWKDGAEETLARLRARTFGYILQTGGLLPFLSVFDNVALPLRLLGRHDRERVQSLAESLGLAPYLKAQPHQLSVGQRQRVAIARALVHRPPVVLADEPTASLDPENAAVVMALLLDAVRRQGSALVLATHDAEMVRRFGIPTVVCAVSGDGGTTRSSFALQPQKAAV